MSERSGHRERDKQDRPDKAGRKTMLRFVLFDAFVANWRRLGLNDEHQRELELDILQHSKAAPVMKGTAG